MSRIIRGKPAEDKFKGPVAWLFGRELIASLKGTLLFTAFKGKLDSRDWMKPTEHCFADKADGGEFWFDYMADTGDGQKATYSIAYLCLSDAFIVGPKDWENLPADEIKKLIDDKKLEIIIAKPKKQADKKSDDSLPTPKEQVEHGIKLPRGHFLFVGGDTSYHIADYATLAERIQEPFWWAYRDLNEGRSDKDLDSDPRRPLFAIPGNHDYYDALDGFNRQFRQPSTEEGEGEEWDNRPQLSLPSFERHQGASYVSLKLPFGWCLWGLDTQQGDIDFRQLQFFKNRNGGEVPNKLIVATPEPSTVFGKFIDKDETMSLTFEKLGLNRHFLETESQKEFPPGYCRLDISGDVHHYARYWGPDSKKGVSASGKKPALTSTNYASVMSGLGGAFLHPSHTDIHELEEQALYPREEVSRKVVASRIFNPLNIYHGGYVFLVGAIIALIVYFGIEISPNGKPIRETLNGLNDSMRDNLSVPPPPTVTNDTSIFSTIAGKIHEVFAWLASLVSAAGWLNWLFIAISVVAIWTSFWYFKHIIKQLDNKDSGKKKLKFIDYVRGVGLILISIITILPLLFIPKLKTEGLTNSFLFLVPLVWSLGAIATSLTYSELLLKQAKQNPEESLRRFFRERRHAPNWVLFVFTPAVLAVGLYKFQGSAVMLIFDLIFIGTLLLGIVGLPLWALFSGLELHRLKYVKGLKWLRRMGNISGFVILGIWHGVLQLLTSLLLVRLASSWANGNVPVFTWILALVILILISLIFTLIAIKLAQSNRRVLLTALWLIYGLSILVPSLLLYRPVVIDSVAEKAFYCLLAVIIGAITSCTWLGWYLAVALSFNGHNNEAGGASRVEEYKEFIRFRIDERGLTAFVIAIDEPKVNGSDLRPHIIDYFQLRPLKSTEG